jgi:two-component system CheB/CheR fusion protein
MKNNKPAQINSEANPDKSFFIVGIGASAGGLEAVSELLEHLPQNPGMAFVYIQHLDPNHESMLSVILARSTKMKVSEAENKQKIEADHFYIIPPNMNMSIVDGMLTLDVRKAKPVKHLPVDQFLCSLAEEYQEDAIGIILSGNANDGTIGLKAIKQAGGITIVQDDTAKFKSMPSSAVAEGVVDMVLSPKEIAKELELISKKAAIIPKEIAEVKELTETEELEEFRNILQLLRRSTGVDFNSYKPNTIGRRVRRRMLLYKLESLKEYTQYIKQHTNEINLLFNDLLINVTSFFRDMEAMECLKNNLLPNIIKNKKANEPIRIWVPACSSGEEVYSIAILLMEVLGEKAANTAIQIFGTDISEIAISKARQGVYSPNQLAEVSQERLDRFFTKTDGHYRVIKIIRDLCVFAPHNIFSDPPFSRLDIVSCCNLMIYLDMAMQKKILAIFHYALNNNGYLILGKSETASALLHLFTQVEKKLKIYSRKKDVDHKALMEMSYRVKAVDRVPVQYPVDTRQKEEKVLGSSIENLVDNVLLSNYVPACVVITAELEILQFRGSTSLFLEPSSGKASFNLMKMARPELAFELRSAIHKSNKTGERVRKSGLEVKIKETPHMVSIEVIPVKADNEDKLFLVVFEESKDLYAVEPKGKISKDEVVKQLQEELTRVREDMRSIVEEQEASHEELQSANEEVVSSNEELQSINEELETAKEEVESTNEELMTINTELQMRNQQLAESYDYSEAMFTIIREAVIVLDNNLRIKSANAAFYKMFRVSEEGTIGNLIYELNNRQWNFPNLRQFLEKIIPENTEVENFKVTHTFPQVGEKVLLLNARRVLQKTHQLQLILLAIEDITEHAKAEKLLEEREAWFRNMADNAPAMIFVTDTFKSATFFNWTWLQYTGKQKEEEYGDGWLQSIHKEDLNNLSDAINASFTERRTFTCEFRLRRNDGEYRWVKITGNPTHSITKEFTGYVNTVVDIHDQKLVMAELDKVVSQRTHELEHSNRELERSNNELQQFAYVASHDMQEPLRKIITFSDRLQQYKEHIPERGRIFLEKIEVSSQRMTKLIDDLLNFSTLEHSEQKFSRTDLNKTLSNLVDDFELIMAQKKAKIVYSKLPVINAIPIQMEQLFHNLISNALKFSKEDTSPIITISSEKLSEEEFSKYPQLNRSIAYYKIIFKDNGIGFKAEYADQIFVIFQRLNEVPNIPGTGIGLALCRKIVNNHGGLIYARSNPGEGSEFYIILPEKQEP